MIGSWIAVVFLLLLYAWVLYFGLSELASAIGAFLRFTTGLGGVTVGTRYLREGESVSDLGPNVFETPQDVAEFIRAGLPGCEKQLPAMAQALLRHQAACPPDRWAVFTVTGV